MSVITITEHTQISVEQSDSKEKDWLERKARFLSKLIRKRNQRKAG